MIMQAFPCCSCNRTGGVGGPGGVADKCLWAEQRNQLEKEMKKIGEGQAVGCSVACLGSLTIWLIKFSKPQTNHSKNLIKCVKKIVYYFYKNKVVCLQFYNHFFISSFSHNSFLCFTFLLLFLHFHNVLLCTLYTWVGKSPENLKLAMH